MRGEEKCSSVGSGFVIPVKAAVKKKGSDDWSYRVGICFQRLISNACFGC